jgi:hypothetical protein
MQDSEPGPGDCLACTHFGLLPVMPSVDPSGRSKDEADSLCTRHRARMTEGACVLCGRRESWLVLHEKSDIGSCRPCYAALFGEEAARDVEAVWRALDVAGSL